MTEIIGEVEGRQAYEFIVGELEGIGANTNSSFPLEKLTALSGLRLFVRQHDENIVDVATKDIADALKYRGDATNAAWWEGLSAGMRPIRNILPSVSFSLRDGELIAIPDVVLVDGSIEEPRFDQDEDY